MGMRDCREDDYENSFLRSLSQISIFATNSSTSTSSISPNKMFLRADPSGKALIANSFSLLVLSVEVFSGKFSDRYCDRVVVKGSCDSYSSQGETKEVTIITSSKASPSIESAKYDVDRLVKVLTAIKPLAEIITLRWGKDLPLELTVKAPGSPVLSLKFWLASLVES